LYNDRQLPPLTIDTSSFTAALSAGELDACLLDLRRVGEGPANASELNCRLAEALFHYGRREDALDCGRRALLLGPQQQHALDFSAWLFSNCGCHEEAADAYRRLVELRPDWIEGYRHLSGSLAAVGAIDQAVVPAMTASDLAPHSAEFALHAGHLLLCASRHQEAAAYLGHALSIEPQNSRALRELSVTALALGNDSDALELAARAAALAPDDGNAAVHAAELLQRSGRPDDAAVLLRGAAERVTDDPQLLRVLSAVEMVRERFAAALDAIDRAIGLAPDETEYRLHRAHLLLQLGDFDSAADAIEGAAALDPANPDVKRAQLTLCLAEGRLIRATALAGELLRDHPEDDAAAEAARQVIERRLDAIDGDYIVLGNRQLPSERPSRPPPDFVDRLLTQCRVVYALIIRETRTRFGDSRLGYAWALIEPVMHIAMLSAVFSLLMHGQPPIGTEFFIFYFTGLIRYSGADGTKPPGYVAAS
jgi:tetratricopeptide (TPR) repeat protein